MTRLEFNTYLSNIKKEFYDLNQSMIDRVNIGVDYKEQYYKLSVLKGYLDILNNFTLFKEDETYVNMYTVEEMIDLNQKINILLNTSYECDFVEEYEPELLDYDNFITITDVDHKIAFDDFIKELKENDIWDKLIGIYPIYGGTSAKAAINLKSAGSLTITWSTPTAPTFNSLDVDFNGNSYGEIPEKFSDLGITTNDCVIGCYSDDSSGFEDDGYDIGVKDAIGETGIYRLDEDQIEFYINTFTASTITYTGKTGLFLVSRLSNTGTNYNIDGTNASDISASSAMPDYTTYIGAENDTGTASVFSSSKYKFFFFGYGLSLVEIDYFKVSLYKLLTALGKRS